MKWYDSNYNGDVYCKDCGILLEKGSKISKKGHQWEQIKEEKATCEKEGSKTYICVLCQKTRTETIEKTEHKYSGWKTILEQSVMSAEKQERICSVCGKTQTRTIGSKLKPTMSVNKTSLKLNQNESTNQLIVYGMEKRRLCKIMDIQ